MINKIQQEETMKYFIILVFAVLICNADEHRLLLTGFTKHEVSHKKNGEEFNEFNYGAGYEYTTFEHYNELYLGTNLTALRDSYDEPQYTLSVSPNIRFELTEKISASVGAAAFVMYKKNNYKRNVSEEEAKYELVFGAAPLASLYYKRLSVNFAYVPSFSYDKYNMDIIGFAIMYFGWKL